MAARPDDKVALDQRRPGGWPLSHPVPGRSTIRLCFRRANVSIEMAAWSPRTRGHIHTGHRPEVPLEAQHSRELDAVMKYDLRYRAALGAHQASTE
jgi:hypothetical protein